MLTLNVVYSIKSLCVISGVMLSNTNPSSSTFSLSNLEETSSNCSTPQRPIPTRKPECSTFQRVPMDGIVQPIHACNPSSKQLVVPISLHFTPLSI